jgi:hypothetical protein
MRGYAKTTIKNPQAGPQTGLASLGVVFRFLTVAGQADAQTLGGIYEVPPIFLFASRRT